jgi:hydroxymethylbilane synthase
MKLIGFIASVDGSRTLKESIIGPVHACEHLGCELAERLLRNGGKEILEEVYQREIGSK